MKIDRKLLCSDAAAHRKERWRQDTLPLRCPARSSRQVVPNDMHFVPNLYLRAVRTRAGQGWHDRNIDFLEYRA